jgi:hypothetical protein
MKRFFFWFIILGVIAIGAGALLWKPTIPRQLTIPDVPDPPPEKKTAPAIAYPLPDVGNSNEPLPVLDNSDNALSAALTKLHRRLGEWLVTERLARNIVATIDNLPREEVSTRIRPVKPIPGKFITAREGALHIAPENDERYRKYVRMFEESDPEQVVALYLRFYPIFQKAYQELGYPDRYFNDQVVAVIDHLLDAPEPEGEVALTQPKVLFEFADPELQRASAGHKVMMRIGPDNARRVKTHLKKVRAKLVAVSEQVRGPS